MKIVLFGANGQVGRACIAQAQVLGVQLVAYTKQEVDIVDMQLVATVLTQQQPQVVINAAAYTAVERAEQEPALAWQINASAVQGMAAVCSKLDLPLIHISTDYVFNGEQDEPYTEGAAHSPLNYYGRSKAAGDELLINTWHKHVIVRVSWVFGVYGINFVKKILTLAASTPMIKVVDDQIGCPTSAQSIAAVVLTIAARIAAGTAVWGIFNYCNDASLSWYEFALLILEHAHQHYFLPQQQVLPISSNEYVAGARRPRRVILDLHKIADIYHIYPASLHQELLTVLAAL